LAKAATGDVDLEKGPDPRPISKSDNFRINRKALRNQGFFWKRRMNVRSPVKAKAKHPSAYK
jgi:hypothetical protein